MRLTTRTSWLLNVTFTEARPLPQCSFFRFALDFFRFLYARLGDCFASQKFVLFFLLLLEVIAGQVTRTALAFGIVSAHSRVNAISCFAESSAFVIAVWAETASVNLSRRVALTTSFRRTHLHLRPFCRILIRLNELFDCPLTCQCWALTIEKRVSSSRSDFYGSLWRNSITRHRRGWRFTEIDRLNWVNWLWVNDWRVGLNLVHIVVIGLLWLCGFVCGQGKFTTLLSDWHEILSCEILSWKSWLIYFELRRSLIEQLLCAVQYVLS